MRSLLRTLRPVKHVLMFFFKVKVFEALVEKKNHTYASAFLLVSLLLS